jgi:hypothetical protein
MQPQQPPHTLPAKSTYDLAKGFYHVSNAIKYFESVKGEKSVSPKAKHVLGGLINRLEWCLRDIMTNMSPQSADLMREQVCTYETLAFDAVFDEMVLMNEAQRGNVEVMVKAYREGAFDIQVNPELDKEEVAA